MKRAWKLVLALVLVLALALTAWLVLRDPAEEPTEEAPAEENMIYSVDSLALTGLRWTWEDHTLSLVKESGDWVCGNAPDVAIDQSTAAMMAQMASGVAYSKALDETANPSEFGFDAPRMTIQLYLGDATGTLTLGLRNDFLGQDYARYADGSIYLIDAALYDAFAVELKNLVPQDSLPTLSTTAIKSLTVTTPEGSRTLVQPENYQELSYAGTYTWFEQQNDEYRALSTTAVSEIATVIAGLQLTDCVAYQPENLAVYGLDTPTVCVAVDYESADSSGAITSGSYVLEIGDETEPEELLGENPEDLESLDEEVPAQSIYVRMADSDLVYTAEVRNLENLTGALSAELRPEDVCRVDWSTVRAMRVTVDGETNRLGIETLETEDENGEIVSTPVYSIDGRESTYDEIYDIFRQIRYMSTEAVVEDTEPEGEPYITVEFHRDSDTFSVMPLKLYAYDNSFYLVQFAGDTRLLVSRRDVEALAESIRALR